MTHQRSADTGSLGGGFAETATARPEHVALRGPAGAWTFAELDQRSNRIANALLDRLGPDEAPVALLYDHDAPLVAAMLGVLKAGKLILVLDPEAPEPLRDAILADAGAPVVVADEAHAEVAGSLPVDAVTDADLVAAGGPEAPALEVGPERGAMLAYTSGTTGAPKAAVLPHRALVHLMNGATDALGIGPDDTLPMLFPVSLAVAAYPMFLPLVNGGTLTTFDVRGLGLAELPRWFADEGVTVIYMAPTVARFLADAVGDTTFPDLRLVVLGGERVDADAVALVRSLFGDHLEVANGYGTTETGVLTFRFVQRGETFGEAGVPVGYPIPGMDLQIRDDELFVRSPYLFSGYWKRPDLDARVLDVDPDTGVPVYRTGDLARIAEDGCLEVTGRTDTQVKIRGQRVVPGEVEDALLSLAQVKDAVVTTPDDATGTRILVAHVVPAAGEDVTVDQLRAAIGELVSAAMVPSRFVLHEALPQLPNGKLDRRALDEEAPVPPSRGATDLDDLEAQLVAIWEELLGVSPIHVDDDFFELGGYSLLAAQMLVKVEERLGHQVPMAALLDGATVATLATSIRAHVSAAGGVVRVQAGDESRRPLFFAHDLHGSAFRFRFLARAIGEDQPFYSFESPFLAGRKLPISSIDTLALRYVTELRRVQPEGPYLVAGYSFGGVVAFEMARRLRRDGHEVAFCGIVDVGPGYRGIDYSRTRPPPGPWFGVPEPADPSLSLPARMGYYRDMARRTPRGAMRHVIRRAELDRWFLPYQWRWQLRRHGQIPPGHRLWYAYRRHWELAGRDWDPQPGSYPGRITLFWAKGTGSTDSEMGWGEIATEGVDVRRVSVEHEHLMDEDLVGEIGGALRRAIDEV